MYILSVLVVVTTRQKAASQCSLRHDVNRNQVNCTGTIVSLCCIPTVTLYATIRPGNRILPVKITGSQLVKNFPAFYGTRRFIAAFKRARHLSLSWTRPIQSIPLIPLLIDALKHYFSIYALVFKVVSGFSKKNPICSYPVSHMCHMPRANHCSCFDHSNNIWCGVEIIFLLVMYSSPPFCYLVFLRPNTYLSTCSQTPSAYILPSIWHIKFYSGIKTTENITTRLQNIKIAFCPQKAFVLCGIQNSGDCCPAHY